MQSTAYLMDILFLALHATGIISVGYLILVKIFVTEFSCSRASVSYTCHIKGDDADSIEESEGMVNSYKMQWWFFRDCSTPLQLVGEVSLFVGETITADLFLTFMETPNGIWGTLLPFPLFFFVTYKLHYTVVHGCPLRTEGSTNNYITILPSPLVGKL